MNRQIVFVWLLAVAQCADANFEYGLCSEVYQMHQYCTAASEGQGDVTAETGHHGRAIGGRIGKSGPRGPRGFSANVNYTIIDGKIEEKFKELERRIDEKLQEYDEFMNETRTGVAKVDGGNRELERRIDEKLQEYDEFMNETRRGGAKVDDGNRVYPTDCGNVTEERAKLRERGKGGVFDIYPSSRLHSVEVYCDLVTDGGGWTVFQRRMDGSVDFYRNWTSYVNGFGYSDKEFWLGLETIHELTNVGEYELRVDLGDWEGNTFHAKYGSFSISGSADNYRLAVDQYSGDAGDSLSYHDDKQFSTYDQNHDSCTSTNCAETKKGAWWYCYCYNSNLNGLYHKGGKYKSSDYDGVAWYYLKNDSWYSLKFAEMKFRKKN